MWSPIRGTTFPQSSTGTLVVLRYPTQNSWDFSCKMFRYWLHYSHGFPTGCGGCPQIWRFSPEQQMSLGHITSKAHCTSAKVSSLGLWLHWLHYLKSPLYKCKKVSSFGLWLHWPQWTSTHQQRTIHWMPVITQLWMNVNWVNIWFNLGNQFCKK